MPLNECFYHEDKEATGICARCSRQICLKDTTEIYNKKGESVSLCKLCNLNRQIRIQQRDRTNSVLISISLGLLIPLLTIASLIISFFLFLSVVLILVPLVILGLLFTTLMIVMRKESAKYIGGRQSVLLDLKNQRINFIDSITSTSARKIVQKMNEY